MKLEAPTVRAEPALDAFVDWAAGLSWESVAERTRRMVKRELLDYFGAALAGRAVAGMPDWLSALTAMGGRPDATVIGGPRVPGPAAALCNGYFGHVLEYDDTHDGAVLHAGAAAIPSALAAAQLLGRIGGSRLCEAALVGIELTCRLGVATRLNLVDGGWLYTTLFGHFGAAAAAARLIAPEPALTRHALGVVYSLAAGAHQPTREGATTKHVQPGFAASHGVLAAIMAANGLTGVAQPLTGEDGLARVYLREQFDATRVSAGLGVQYEIDRLSFKPYPTCRLTHPAIGAALKLRDALGSAAGDIERVELTIGPQAYDVVGRAASERLNPATRVGAQFSVQWTVAAALVHGRVTPRELMDEVPPSPDLAKMISRIQCRADSMAARRDIGGCTLRATGPFGTREVHELNAKGHPDNPLSDDELSAKFGANVRLAGLNEVEAMGMAQCILEIDRAPDLASLLGYLEHASTAG